MAKATQAQKVQRLNLAHSLLRRYPPPRVLQELVRRCSLSPRHAYRYLQQARHLQQPLPIVVPKVAFTVKLPRPLVAHLRRYAARTSRNLSQTVSQALSAMLHPRRRRG